MEAAIRRIVPANEIASLIDNIGLPYSSINMSYSTSAPIGTMDTDILVTLTQEHHPTDEYVRRDCGSACRANSRACCSISLLPIS